MVPIEQWKNSAFLIVFTKCCEALRLWLCLHHSSSVQHHWRNVFLACGLYKREFRTCLNSWSTWMLALDSIEQSQSSCVIVNLDQERYVEKSIIYILLQVSISNIGIRAFIHCSRCHKHIWLVLNTFYASEMCYEFLCTSYDLQWQVLILSISCLEINIFFL